MKFGVVLQTDPPARRVVELAQLSEKLGFSYVWTFDSPVLWEEPFVIYSQILATTSSVKVGPMVTNPLSRGWAVTASLFATLNEMYGNRTVCGIGRGDSVVRVLGRQPASLGTLEKAMVAIKDLAEGRRADVGDASVVIPWVEEGELDIFMAAYGPRALELAGRRADGLILQIADPFVIRWAVETARSAAVAAGRGRGDLEICVAAPAYVGDNLADQRDQLRWFGGMVGNHVADIVERYGATSAAVPDELTSYISGRRGYDYAHHGKPGNPTTDFVPDEVVERFCVLGPVANHLARMTELEALGVDQFAIYLMHDRKEATLQAYSDEILPVFAGLQSQ
ncbi:MAG TPA: TIGR03842 family LLM class F420-dependent oxidoreductase [Acidimicrobiales bacterium]|nr:TIGR03842 family LLM class F420-dependent oxidoreductase [Acidimicrobiales bacterium]